jgi:hypothetical protein
LEPFEASATSPIQPSTQRVEIKMMDIILSTHEIYFFLVFVVLLFFAALRTRQPDPPVGQPRSPAPTAKRLSAAPGFQRVTSLTLPLGGVLYRSPSATPRSFSDLQTILFANYAGKVQRAIQTIRIEPPAGTRPRD